MFTIQYKAVAVSLQLLRISHAVILGQNLERMACFSQSLIQTLTRNNEDQVYAWRVLPNHWHALVSTKKLKVLSKYIGQLHGKSSHAWNGEDETRKRQCWHGYADRRIRNERHLFAERNYIHHNPVRHGHTAKWQEWPYSSAASFL